MIETRTFPCDRGSVPAARRFATDALAGSADELLQTVALMVSELATNCIRHVDAEFELTIRRTSSEIRVEVSDRGAGMPAMRSPGPNDPTGRGLRIVDMLSQRWGVTPKACAGKTVWFTVAAAGAGAEEPVTIRSGAGDA
ncbi:MAG: ATP-binding protein [Solirubrobacteraceae bacterium]